MRWYRHGDPLHIKRRPDGLSLENAFRHHMPGNPPETGCWIWSKSVDDGGYGCLGSGRNVKRAHIVSFLIFNGPIPAKQLIRHTCDVRNCVQPKHLIVGEVRDNSNDMVTRGRSCVGEKNARCILAEEQVIEIRRLASAGSSQAEIARMFGVSRANIGSIVHRRTWKHL